MPRPSALSYQIAHITPNEIDIVPLLFAPGGTISGLAIEGAAPPKSSLASAALPPREFCEKSKDTYPSPRALQICGT